MISHEIEPQSEQGNVTLDPFSVRYTATLLVNSFRYSQGSEPLQRGILRYLATRYEDRLDTDIVAQAVDGAAEIAGNIRSNPKTHKQPLGFKSSGPSKNDRSTVKTFADRLSGFLENAKGFSSYQLQVDGITKETIAKDYLHLGIERDTQGRYRESTAVVTPFNDPNISFWVYYGLMGGNTGMPEYNAMFTEMVDDFRAHQGYSEDIRSRSARLAGFQLLHHPQQIAALSHVDTIGANLQGIYDQV